MAVSIGKAMGVNTLSCPTPHYPTHPGYGILLSCPNETIHNSILCKYELIIVKAYIIIFQLRACYYGIYVLLCKVYNHTVTLHYLKSNKVIIVLVDWMA